ncbi:MAG: PHP domain-containing protein [Flavipsychrobacter sp.]|nr:PHP domain-containing protein [Flavipsychrobacter sp.]
MNNSQIADHFTLVSKLMDIHGENSFKSKSYANAAFNIDRLTIEISNMDDAELYNIRGIGEAIGKKIRELQATGTFPVLESLLQVTPEGVIEMMRLKGLGPKKIGVIWKELEIESVGELEYACNENRLVTLKGFGAKTQDNILQQIAYIKQNEGFSLWAHVVTVANLLVNNLKGKYPNHLFALAGAVRRQLETVEYIDIVTDATKKDIIEGFSNIVGMEVVDNADSWIIKTPNNPSVNFISTSKSNFYTTLFNASASEQFLSAFHEKYKLPDEAESEEYIFAINNIPVVHSAQRETGKVLGQPAFQLIQPDEIKGIIHSHSTWSDGSNTLEEMAKGAIDKGYEYLVISDHSQAAFYANGLTPQRIVQQHIEIDALNEKLAPFKIFKSIEADILNDGSLDYIPAVLNTFDLVIGSVHSNLRMSEEKAMARVLAAVANPYLTILGHPTSRLLLSRPGYPLDHKQIIDACAEHKVVIEINAHPRRLDMDWRWIDYAMDRGVLLSIDPDAHSIKGFEDIYYGVMIAQKGGLTASSNLSSFSLTEFEAFLEGYRRKRMH